jgi:hypothetical protein
MFWMQHLPCIYIYACLSSLLICGVLNVVFYLNLCVGVVNEAFYSDSLYWKDDDLKNCCGIC